MKEQYSLTRAEQEVMEVLWEREGPVQTGELLERMRTEGRTWKRQTLNTILFRLEEKGIVSRSHAYVQAALTGEELLQKRTQNILDNFYEGKIGNFFAALTGNTHLKEEEADKLNDMIDQLKNQWKG